ncbi:MAG TPA: MarR family transcriptional regulator [Thermoanaerobaculia bacterium]|nr:MarR family transcriptional regulator [Thermoanaerobaculia bacterium]
MADETSALAKEIRQQRPFRSLGQEAALGLMRTTDLLRRAIARVLEPYDVTPQQYNVLRILRGAGEQGLPTLEIGDRMIEQAPGITRLLDRLEAKGWVTRKRCTEDRRQVLCWLTPAGRDLVQQLDEPVDQADATAMEMLSDQEKRELIRLLDQVRTGLR